MSDPKATASKPVDPKDYLALAKLYEGKSPNKSLFWYKLAAFAGETTAAEKLTKDYLARTAEYRTSKRYFVLFFVAAIVVFILYLFFYYTTLYNSWFLLILVAAIFLFYKAFDANGTKKVKRAELDALTKDVSYEGKTYRCDYSETPMTVTEEEATEHVQ